MNAVIQVACGGALGALARFGAIQLVTTPAPGTFPWPVFLVNVSGCLIIGLLAGLSGQWPALHSWRLFLFTGILGGYTTFSSFGLETLELCRNKAWLTAVYYVLGTNVVGIAAVFGGYRTAELL